MKEGAQCILNASQEKYCAFSEQLFQVLDDMVGGVLKHGYKSFDTAKKKLWCHFHEARTSQLNEGEVQWRSDAVTAL